MQKMKANVFHGPNNIRMKKCSARMPALAKRSFGSRSPPFVGPTFIFCVANIR